MLMSLLSVGTGYLQSLPTRTPPTAHPPAPPPFHIKNNQEGIEAISFGLLCLEYFRAQRGPELDVIRENTELPE